MNRSGKILLKISPWIATIPNGVLKKKILKPVFKESDFKEYKNLPWFAGLTCAGLGGILKNIGKRVR